MIQTISLLVLVSLAALYLAITTAAALKILKDRR